MNPGSAGATLRSLALLLALALPAVAQDVSSDPANRLSPLKVPAGSPPTFTIFTPRDGLGDEIWSTVGQGPDGFVWAGSASSLSRFDGYRWHDIPDAPGRSLVRDMANDRQGRLWVIFEREGLAYYDGKGWHRVGEARFHQRFSTVGEGESRELWVAHNDGLARLEGDTWVEDPGNPVGNLGRAIAFARTASVGGEPREWLATADRGLWYRRASSEAWRRHEHPALANLALTDIKRVQDKGVESLWVVSYGGGVARLRGNQLRLWRAETGELPTEAVYSAVATHDADGEAQVWMASRAGLLRFRGERVDVFDRRHGLPAEAVRGVKLQHDSDGVDSLWLATEGGVARATLAASPWNTVSLLGAADNGSFGVLVEPDGRGSERLWVGSSRDGLALLEQGNWRYFRQGPGGLPARSVRGLWRLPGDDGRQHLVLSQPGAPLFEIDGDFEVRPIDVPWPIQPETGANHVIARSVDGQVEWWAATNHAGVHRLRGGEWTSFRHLGDEGHGSVHWLLAQTDAQGRQWLWAADSRGIARFDGQRWQRLNGDLGLPRDGFRSLSLYEENGRDVLWGSSTHHGIVRLDVQDPLRPQRITRDGPPPPPDPTIYSTLRDSQGRIYVCTNNGVQQLTPRAEGGWDERVFRRRDGLVHDECNTNSQFIDSHDRYWVGTLGGLSMYDPNLSLPGPARSPKPLRLTALHLAGETIPLPADGALRLPAGRHELRVEYSLLTGLRERESMYRTQMLGLEARPGAWTTQHDRTFSGLAPGDYRLRIQARDFAGIEATPIELAVTVPPLWWQQAWLQGLAVVALLIASLVLVALYNRGLRRRQRQLRQEVAERTSALNDANQRLTELSYLDPLTGIANRRRLVEAMKAEMQRAQDQQKPLGLIVADVDHFKQYNDRFGHLAGDAALRAIATAMGSAMREQDLVARFGGEEFACLMIDADLATVQRVAERMRLLVEALPPRALGNDSQTLTISAGVLSAIPLAGQNPEDLLHMADQALYEAKAGGRNRVFAAARA